MWDLSSLTRDRTPASAVLTNAPPGKFQNHFFINIFFFIELYLMYDILISGVKHNFFLYILYYQMFTMII